MADTSEVQILKPEDTSGEDHAASDRETDTFEDAVDTTSVRSLTARKSNNPEKTTRLSTGPTDARSERSVSPGSRPQSKVRGVNGEDQPIHLSEEKDSEDRPPQLPKRISNASLDNVNLDEAGGERKNAHDEAPPVPKKQPAKKISLGNIANSLPAMPWSPPSGSTDVAGKTSPSPGSNAPFAAPPPAAASRKLTSPFSWLSRNSSQKDTVTSPPATAASPRRNTASSIATLTSNPEMMLSKLEEGDEGDGAIARPSRNSLRDRFKMVRMREEAGISLTVTSGDEDKSPGAIASLIQRSTTLSVASPAGEVSPDAPPPASPVPPSPNLALAPGTVSGVSAGPSLIGDAQVDWDFWQSVVYEGPAAVARSSPEELNRAIATGIPNVIRGVVWQVLAQSKNEDLEVVYRELIVRGTEKEKDRSSNATSLSTTSNSNLSVDKEAVVSSSASSITSDSSGLRSPPPPIEKDNEAAMKAHATAVAEKKKKEKEDTAMLQKLEKTIRRDLGARTSFSKHAAAAGLQDGLFGVCKAYALFDEGVGYAQGMNFLIMPLLFNMPEEEAFCLLVRLMNQYKLRDLFIQDMPGLHMHLYQFERLLEDLEPAVYCHLHRRGISPHLYATQWFLTLFAYRFPLQLVLRIYDLILSEGLSAILKFGIVLMQKNAETLLSMSDMAQLTTFLKDKVFDVYHDQAPSAGSLLENGFFGSSSSNVDKEVYKADQLVRDACEVKVTPELLKTYTTEWEEKTRTEKEREQELETLRQSNHSYSIKVRKLEDRIEACDGEQASMANELVHTKIENEELKDENEGLKGQVKELRTVIEKQPTEIEEAWKAERDNLMERNSKVHEENQKVEKEMAELEEELVATKMRWAELNAAHDTLQGKWRDLKKQFD